MKTTHTYQKGIRVLFYILLALGVFLRLYEYFKGKSIGEDEATLALDLMQRNYRELMDPAPYDRSLPLFFVFSIKTLTIFFGYSLYVLRFLPLLLTLLTLGLFYHITFELTRNRIIALIVFLIFILNPSLIHASAELSPFIMDVCFYLMLVYLVVGSNNYVNTHRNKLLLIVGCLSILFSNSAFIILSCIVCKVLWAWYKENKGLKQESKIIFCWFIVFIINAFVIKYQRPLANDQTVNYVLAYVPKQVLSLDFFFFVKHAIQWIFFDGLLNISKAYKFSWIIFLILVVASRYFMNNKKNQQLIFIWLPIILTLLFSVLKRYPFYDLFILFLIPSFIILISLGTYRMAYFIKRKVHVLPAFLFVLLCSSFYLKKSVLSPESLQSEIAASVSYINEHFPDKTVYSSDQSQVYEYYYKAGKTKAKSYKKLNEKLTMDEFEELSSDEKKSYVLLVKVDSTSKNAIVENLKNEKRINGSFIEKGYAVYEVKALPVKEVVSTLDYTYFNPQLIRMEDNAVAIWGGAIVSNPLQMKQGNYKMYITSRGTPVRSVYPELNIYVNENVIGEYSNTSAYSTSAFSFKLLKDTAVIIKIGMENDIAEDKEDRNSFIKQIVIKRE